MNLPLPLDPRVSVIIITRDRPGMLRDCLAKLAVQSDQDFETIVVDSSRDDLTAQALAEWPNARSVRIRDARNNMPQARNAGTACAKGRIVAFLDDDSMASRAWLAALVAAYEGQDVGGVGGRALDERLRLPGEKRIGVVQDDGRLIGNFAADPGTVLQVDWLAGCNMSYSRSAIDDTGEFDPSYTGDNSFEEVDYGTRVRKAGYRLVFAPQAVVTHLAAGRGRDQVRRDQLDPRARFYTARNETYFCLKNLGPTDVVLRRMMRETFGKLVYTCRHLDARLAVGSLTMLAGRVAGSAAWAKRRLRPVSAYRGR